MARLLGQAAGLMVRPGSWRMALPVAVEGHPSALGAAGSRGDGGRAAARFLRKPFDTDAD